VPEEELKRAKAMIINSEILGNQTNANMAVRAVLDELYGLGYAHSKDFQKLVEGITAKDLLDTANKYLKDPLTVQLDGTRK
jgi:Predicted Zn-dependent peptidases